MYFAAQLAGAIEQLQRLDGNVNPLQIYKWFLLARFCQGDMFRLDAHLWIERPRKFAIKHQLIAGTLFDFGGNRRF